MIKLESTDVDRHDTVALTASVCVCVCALSISTLGSTEVDSQRVVDETYHHHMYRHCNFWKKELNGESAGRTDAKNNTHPEDRAYDK